MGWNRRPGSLPWLFAHDARLGWRDFRATFGGLGSRALVLLLLVLVCVMHAAAWPVATGFAGAIDESGIRSQVYLQAAPAVLFVLLLLVAQTLNGVTKLLYARGDLELMLSSPISARKVLFVRSLTVAGGALASASIFVLPFANAGLLSGHVRFAALYPALLGASLAAAAVSLLTALGLFALVGPRVTRLAAQILATFIGAGFMLGLQLHRFLPSFSLAAVLNEPQRAHGWTRVMLLPVRAALGEPPWLAAWLAVSFGLFCLAVIVLGNRFATSASIASTLVSRPWRDSASARAKSRPFAWLRRDSFRGGLLTNLRLKEWRLISRDPWVVSQILLQILYMTPMLALLWSGGGSIVVALGPMTVVVAFQVASSLTWLGLSGEDAPDLLATAPVTPAALRRGKFEAVGTLTFAVIAVPFGWLATVSLSSAMAILPLVIGAICSAMVLQLWHAQPRKRSAFAARHRESKLLSLIEMALSMLWGVSTALLVLNSFWSVVPVAVLAGVLLCARPRRGRSAFKASRAEPV